MTLWFWNKKKSWTKIISWWTCTESLHKVEVHSIWGWCAFFVVAKAALLWTVTLWISKVYLEPYVNTHQSNATVIVYWLVRVKGSYTWISQWLGWLGSYTQAFTHERLSNVQTSKLVAPMYRLLSGSIVLYYLNPHGIRIDLNLHVYIGLMRQHARYVSCSWMHVWKLKYGEAKYDKVCCRADQNAKSHANSKNWRHL